MKNVLQKTYFKNVLRDGFIDPISNTSAQFRALEESDRFFLHFSPIVNGADPWFRYFSINVVFFQVPIRHSQHLRHRRLHSRAHVGTQGRGRGKKFVLAAAEIHQQLGESQL